MIAVTAVTAVAPMRSMPLVTVVCGVVLVSAAASVLGVCVSPALLDGSVASLARTVLGSVWAVLDALVGVFRCGGVGPVRW